MGEGDEARVEEFHAKKENSREDSIRGKNILDSFSFPRKLFLISRQMHFSSVNVCFVRRKINLHFI